MKNLLTALLLPLLFASCSVLKPVEDTSVHYLLDPVVPQRKVTGGSPSVAIAPPALPSYLDRQQLVTRTSNGELEMNTYHLWAEALDAGIARVTSQNLSRLENSLNIQPVKNFVTLEYQTLLELRVSRFEPDASGNVVLDATWKLQPVNGPVASTRSFTTVVPIPGPPAAATAPQNARIAAMNEALARLAREISKSL